MKSIQFGRIFAMGVNKGKLADEKILGQTKVRLKHLPCTSNRSETQMKILATNASQFPHLFLSGASHDTESQYFEVVHKTRSVTK